MSTPHQEKGKSIERRYAPEKLGVVPVSNGRETADLVKELSPNGEIVVHPIKKSAYVHDRLYDLGRIDGEMHSAAERFRRDFEKAQLEGKFASIDLWRSSAGTSGHISDAVAEARNRVRSALRSLGVRKTGKSLSQSCVWFVVGCGHTLEQWALRMRGSGQNVEGGSNTEKISEGKASGILYGALEKLAWHYGITNAAQIKERASNLAAKRARQQTLQEVIALAEISAVGDAKEALMKFSQLLKNKVDKIKTVG